MKTLSDIRVLLLKGIQLSMQSTQSRRAPRSAAVPLLQEARQLLHDLVDREPTNAEAWRMLSLAEESLLNLDNAISYLGKAVDLSQGKDRKDLKRLAVLRQQRDEWDALSLTAEQLRELGDYLSDIARVGPADCTLEWTTRWLDARGIEQVDQVLDELRAKGGYTDFQVLYNVVRG